MKNSSLTSGYSATGELESVRENSTGEVYWRALAEDAAGRLTHEAFGNGVETARQYDSLGRLKALEAQGPQGPVQALSHEYLGNGLLRQRQDGLAGVTEDFSYDALERLTRWQVLAPGQNSEVSYTHDDVGNLLAHTERLGLSSAQRYEYRYGGNGGGPHAVTAYAGDTFRYDAVGRQTEWRAADGRWRHVEYTAVGLPRRVQAQGMEVRFTHDAHQRRVHRRTATGAETVYLGGLYERREEAGTLTHVFHVQARGRPVAQVAWVEKPQGVAASTVWLHADGGRNGRGGGAPQLPALRPASQARQPGACTGTPGQPRAPRLHRTIAHIHCLASPGTAHLPFAALEADGSLPFISCKCFQVRLPRAALA